MSAGGVRWVPRCQLCKQEAPSDKAGAGDLFDCARCGKYEITDSAQSVLKHGSYADDLWILSCVIRNANEGGQVPKLTTYNIPGLIASAPIPRSPLEVMDRLLLRFGRRRSEGHGFRKAVQLPVEEYTLYYLSDQEDLSYSLSALQSAGFLDALKIENRVARANVTVKGWERIAELQKITTDSWQAFVAMRFSPELERAFNDGISPALLETGYQPARVDRLQYNEKVDDKIIAELRRSGLVVADFTDHRGGVYFEAGFGMGRNIPVIYTCRADQIEQAHFDTRQYPHILWSDPSELRRMLIDRIRATLPTRLPLGSGTSNAVHQPGSPAA